MARAATLAQDDKQQQQVVGKQVRLTAQFTEKRLSPIMNSITLESLNEAVNPYKDHS